MYIILNDSVFLNTYELTPIPIKSFLTPLSQLKIKPLVP